MPNCPHCGNDCSPRAAMCPKCGEPLLGNDIKRLDELFSSWGTTERSETGKQTDQKIISKFDEEELEGLLGQPITSFLASGITTLDLTDKGLISLPKNIQRLFPLRKLDLWNNKFSSLPDFIGQLTSLEVLIVNANQLTTLPDTLGQLKSLVGLELSNNQLTSLPESLGNLTSLQWLYLDHNQISSLPGCIGNLTSLQHLHLDNNHLTSLPESIGLLKSLTRLNLNDNAFTPLSESLVIALKTLYDRGCKIEGINLRNRKRVEKRRTKNLTN